MIAESKGTPSLREIINDNHEEINKYISSGKTSAFFFLEIDKNLYIEQTKKKDIEDRLS